MPNKRIPSPSCRRSSKTRWRFSTARNPTWPTWKQQPESCVKTFPTGSKKNPRSFAPFCFAPRVQREGSGRRGTMVRSVRGSVGDSARGAFAVAKFAVILPAAGRSSRFKDKSYKKVFAPLANKAVWLHSAERILGPQRRAANHPGDFARRPRRVHLQVLRQHRHLGNRSRRRRSRAGRFRGGRPGASSSRRPTTSAFTMPPGLVWPMLGSMKSSPRPKRPGRRSSPFPSRAR